MSAKQIAALKERAKMNTPVKSKGVYLFIHVLIYIEFRLLLKHNFMSGLRRLLPLDQIEDMYKFWLEYQ